jgi:hypothetical protein
VLTINSRTTLVLHAVYPMLHPVVETLEISDEGSDKTFSIADADYQLRYLCYSWNLNWPLNSFSVMFPTVHIAIENRGHI